MYYVRACIITTDGTISTSVGVGDLCRNECPRIYMFHPIDVFHMVFDWIDAVKGEWREQWNSLNSFPAFLQPLECSSASKWPPKPGFAPWAYLNSTIGIFVLFLLLLRIVRRATCVIMWSSYVSAFPCNRLHRSRKKYSMQMPALTFW